MAFQGDSIFWVEVEKIVPNPFQPRREFDESKLKELAESIRMYGVLQPLTVTRNEIHTEDGAFRSEYELIAGERRLRASKLAGLSQVPVIIRSGEQTEQEKLELAIIENLQREDLNAVDRALAFRQLNTVFKLSHSQIAAKVGRSREYVGNTLRLLMLPNYMLESLKFGDISEGHARTLLMLNDRPEEQDTVYREILLKKLSVREVERIARKIAQDKVRSKKWKDTDPELIELERKFTESLGTRVQIAKTDYGGKITIDYFSEDDLEELMDRLRKDREHIRSAEAGAAVSAEVAGAAAPEPATAMEPEARPAEEPLESLTAATPLQAAEPPEPEQPGSEQPDAAAPAGPLAEAPNSSTEATDETIVMPEPPVMATSDAPAVVPVEPEAAPIAVTDAASARDDDSHLYAIRNFGV